jgi:hypothetical protein
MLLYSHAPCRTGPEFLSQIWSIGLFNTGWIFRPNSPCEHTTCWRYSPRRHTSRNSQPSQAHRSGGGAGRLVRRRSCSSPPRIRLFARFASRLRRLPWDRAPRPPRPRDAAEGDRRLPRLCRPLHRFCRLLAAPGVACSFSFIDFSGCVLQS